MTSMLAILLSLAMMLTGAAAPITEPASRVLQVSDISVRHNDEEVALSPYASLGVTTDGSKTLFDFFIANGDDIYLPFQVSADENGVLMQNDNSHTTVKVSAEEIDALLSEAVSDVENEEVFQLIGDYFSAYADLFRLMDDPDAMRTIQDSADAIYDQLVDRGQGVAGTATYDDAEFEVLTYEYDLTGTQLGALCDAVYATDARLAKFAEVYFRLLNAMPEDSGLTGFGSFEALMAQFDNVSMHVTESISGDDLNISDIIMHIDIPERETPVEFVIHTVRTDEERTSELTAQIDVEDMTLELYMDSEQSGRDFQVGVNVTVNPTGAAAEAPELEAADEAAFDDEDIIGEADDPTSIYVVEDDEDEDDDDAYEIEVGEDYDEAEIAALLEELLDGEGDREDAYYFTMDYDRSYDEDDRTTEETLIYAVDVAEQDVHAELAVEGRMFEEGGSERHVSGELTIGEERYGFGFNANTSDEAIEDRIDAGAAVSLDEFDPTVLTAGVSADALKLYTDESVQKLIAMIQSISEAAAESGTEVLAEPGAEPAEALEAEPVDASDDEPGEMTFGNPQFNWLPDGYAVENVDVNEEYQDVNCFIVNEATGDSIYVDIGRSYGGSTTNHYILNDDGSYAPVDGVILNEEIAEAYTVYSLDDGTVSISVYPGENTTSEDIIHLLSALTY